MLGDLRAAVVRVVAGPVGHHPVVGPDGGVQRLEQRVALPGVELKGALPRVTPPPGLEGEGALGFGARDVLKRHCTEVAFAFRFAFEPVLGSRRSTGRALHSWFHGCFCFSAPTVLMDLATRTALGAGLPLWQSFMPALSSSKPIYIYFHIFYR